MGTYDDPINADGGVLGRTADELHRRLEGVPRGMPGWRAYESACVDILNFAFSPSLTLIKVQSTTQDGLDRRDAVYAIASRPGFWDELKREFRTRLLVAEFKNAAAPIGQREVESLEQYLLPQAHRAIGVIGSRLGPSPNALAARRRAWVTANKMIVFLSDDEMHEIVDRRAIDDQPECVIERQINSFLSVLTL
jgi:hypothetical protein